jgi:hypothetical protein
MLLYSNYKNCIADGKSNPLDVCSDTAIYYGDVHKFAGFTYIKGNICMATEAELMAMQIIKYVQKRQYRNFYTTLSDFIKYRYTSALETFIKYANHADRKILYAIVGGFTIDELDALFKSIYGSRLYKVLSYDNKSMNGGTYDWTVGEYTEEVHNPVMCSYGYHLTTRPQYWASEKCRIYVAEGAVLSDASNDKWCFNSVILKEEVPGAYIFRYMYLRECGNGFNESIEKIRKEYCLSFIDINRELVYKYSTMFDFDVDYTRELLKVASNR